MGKDTFLYEIDGKTYVQKPLVLGQLSQLLAVLKDARIPVNTSVAGLMEALGGHLPDALAVVLTPEGQSPRDKNLMELSEELSFSVSLPTALQVIEDFFSLNPVSSLLERLTGGMLKITAHLNPATESTGSPSSLPEAISQGVTTSSGDSVSASVNPG